MALTKIEKTATVEELAAALKGVLEDGRFPYCVQDASIVDEIRQWV